jgi:hypothetical protein
MPTMKELSKATRLKPEVIQSMLEPFSVDVEKHPWKSITVQAGETMVLDAGDATWSPSCVRIQPRDVDHLRELVGIPARIYKKRRGARRNAAVPHFNASVLASRLTHRIGRRELLELSPSATMAALKGPQKVSLRKASENLVYGKVSGTAKGTPLYLAAHLDLLRRIIPILILSDIVVKANATLQLSTSLAGILAFRVKIFKGGRIVTPTYAKIHCHTVESKL